MRILARLAMMPVDAPRSFVVRCPPLPDDAFGPPADRLQRAASSTDQQRDIYARYVEESGMCQVCSMHCLAFTEPAPTRLLQLTCGRRACALCYQFERTRCAARRIRRNTNTYYRVMRELRKLKRFVQAWSPMIHRCSSMWCQRRLAARALLCGVNASTCKSKTFGSAPSHGALW